MWKDIPGYRYPYQISDQGEVRRPAAKGGWVYLSPHFANRGRNVVVRLCRAPYDNPQVPVTTLMANAFMGGPRPGYIVAHKNGMHTDFAIENLAWTTHHHIGKRCGGAGRRAVEKLDPHGNIVALYRSISEAAEAEHYSRKAMYSRLVGTVKDPSGCVYRYEEEQKCRKRTRAASRSPRPTCSRPNESVPTPP